MLRKSVGLVVLACVGGLALAQTKEDKDLKKGTSAKVVKADVDKRELTVTADGGKTKRVLFITKDVKFLSPKGAVSKQGIRDPRVKEGVEVRLVFDPKAKPPKLLEVHLVGDAKPGKDKEPKEVKKGPKGKIVKVDADKGVLTVMMEADKKTRAFAITKDVTFIGPRGGVSDKGIKDDRVKVGNEVMLVFDKAGKAEKLLEVHLPVRKKEPDKPKDKPKDK